MLFSDRVTLCMATLEMRIVVGPQILPTVDLLPNLFGAIVLFLTPGVKFRFPHVEKIQQVCNE